ncbi:Multiple antibiotic resistance protein marR [Peptostreptococcus anaerobius]|jgi:DNA-binding MarR family transcriptional regulator|uniref:Multiple antibiotic resistance protein marR n=1 Tax=Peptostreptococcus anaerobius TaxID=1261 RepID=A0A135YME4_9FIRM|nr:MULTISPECIES: MarR family transcriptional regulator [Peptostreptococcus]EKX94454.1 transcriptional regulator, MarR family [Peptostreptococcus anaerobius VPI 4330 = DSM 2949]KXI10556.1 transcriptional regulator, MarR family [Peptostreptococcus anaerobius]MBS5595606.1 MarR family transcriptional regulator [Peptostreptococcus sp.]MDB8822334.1 MarR family transcriptional regulator [Peptostreptococcus anaerobius]MDB8826989.1 MarR family transcriptional regulator [Peptostreptococcus anaerobius]
MQNSIETTISFLVKSLPKLFNDFYLEDIKKFISDKNVNKTQLRALTFIKNYGAINMTELCNMLNIEKGSLTTMIDDLVEKGYVERVNDKKDRRRYIIVMTEAGDVLSDNFMTYLKGSLEQKMERIGMDKMSSLVGSMENIINITESISAK